MRVLVHPDVVDYLLELAETLYEEEYFGFEEQAVEYTNHIFESIKKKLPGQPFRKAPEYFDQFGEALYYCMIKKNKNTQWYAFFSIYEDQEGFVYLVRYISNNHRIASLL